MRWKCMSKALRFLQITAKHQDFPFFTVFLAIKTLSQNIPITLLQSVLTSRTSRPLSEEKAPTNDFIVRNNAASIISNGVISLLWQLWCHCNSDHNKVSSLSNTTVVSIFPNLCLWRRSLHSNLGGTDLEKLYRATLSVHHFVQSEFCSLDKIFMLYYSTE